MKNTIYLFACLLSCMCICSCTVLKDHTIPVEPATCSPVSGIMACYSFSEGGKDNSGNNYTAQIVGATPTTDRFGNPNSAYAFAGYSSYIELPANTFKTDEFTYVAWVKPSRLLQQGEVFTILDTGNGEGDHAMVLAKTTVLGWGMWSYLDNQGNSEFTYSGVLPTEASQWYHVIASRSKDMLKIYVNGVLSASQAMSKKPFYGSNSGSIRTFIGKRFDGDRSFMGSIDEVKIYNRALNDQEAKQIYDLK